MVQTFGEFATELKNLRTDIKKKGKKADAKLVAAWVDKLTISLQKITKKLQLLTAEVETIEKKVRSG